jgi:competence protein ComEC
MTPLLLFGLSRQTRSLWIVPASGALFFFGSWQVERHVHPALPAGLHQIAQAGASARVVAELSQPPVRLNGRSRFFFKNSLVITPMGSERIPGTLMVTVRRQAREWQRGDRVGMEFRLRRPRSFSNPGAFDYPKLLAIRGIHFVGSFYADQEITLLNRPSKGFLAWIDGIRGRLGTFIDTRLPGDEGALMKALTIGETGKISEGIWRKFSLTGVVHVLSISGLHISMFSILTFFFVVWAGSRSTRVLLQTNLFKFAAFLSFFPMLFYVLLAGAQTPAVRSAVMISSYLLAILVDREREVLSGLSLAALLISLLWPGSVAEVSFQLSFASVLAIVLFVGRAESILEAWKKRDLLWRLGIRSPLPARGALYLIASLGAILGTAPLVAYHFNQFSLAGLLANPLVAPIVGFVVVPLGLGASLMAFFVPGLAELVLRLGGFAVSLLIRAVEWFSTLTWMRTVTPTPTALELVALYGVIGSLLWAKRAKTMIGLSFVLLASIEVYLLLHGHHSEGKLRVTFLDVGEGESAVVELPGHAVFVVDGGGLGEGLEYGRTAVARFLWSQRITRVDALVLTSPRLTHYGGLPSLVELFRPGEFWSNGHSPLQGRFQALEQALDRERIRRVWIDEDKRCVAREGVILCAWTEGYQRAAALDLFFGKSRILFLPDGDRDRQRTVRVSGPLPTVLKVSSRSPWDLGPVRSMVSVLTGRPGGVSPPYEGNGPGQETAVFSTADEGAIVVETDGVTTTVRSQSGRELTLRGASLRTARHAPP